MNATIAKEKNEKKSGQKYAELLCDFMFKRLFGSESNKDVLIDFLNMILQDHEIVDVDFIPTEHLGLTKEDRKAVFDISCTCQNGETLIIEVQKGYQEYFANVPCSTRAIRLMNRAAGRRRSLSRIINARMMGRVSGGISI